MSLLDKRIKKGRPNMELSKAFTDQVMSQLGDIKKRKSFGIAALSHLKPALAATVLFLLLGVTIINGGLPSAIRNRGNDQSATMIKDVKGTELSHTNTSDNPTVAVFNNSSTDSAPDTSPIEGAQVNTNDSNNTTASVPTSKQQAKSEVKSLVAEINSESTTYSDINESNLSDDLLSDTIIFETVTLSPRPN